MDVSTMKTVAVLAVIFGCFAVLYPKIFHPMLMQTLGFSSYQEKQSDFGLYSSATSVLKQTLESL